jgi:hypothetical protein
MSHRHGRSQPSGHAPLRPWPFGPPLRGRAPRGVPGGLPPQRQAAPTREGRINASPQCQATAPVGGLACMLPLCSE